MALISDCDTAAVGDMGYTDGTTLNVPMTKDVDGNDVQAISYGSFVCEGSQGNISVQRLTGFEQKENIHPATYQRIDIADGNGFGEWLKIS